MMPTKRPTLLILSRIFSLVQLIVSYKLSSLADIFEPLFEVTKDPSKDPKLHLFLKRIVGFDCVDDESKQERRFHKKFPFPKFWESKANPPYSYYTYYLYANLAFLNQFRKDREFSTRSHCFPHNFFF